MPSPAKDSRQTEIARTMVAMPISFAERKSMAMIMAKAVRAWDRTEAEPIQKKPDLIFFLESVASSFLSGSKEGFIEVLGCAVMGMA